MRVTDLNVHSLFHDYKVFFQSNGAFVQHLTALENAVFVVDQTVWEHYGNTLFAEIPRDRLILQEAKEEFKNLESVCELYRRIMAFAPRKNMTLVSIGGGIIQDITGFVASTLYRGIKWIFVPTTLLAQVDSCIGAKTSLNFSQYKNLIGSFYPPNEIYSYPGFLKTLKREDYFSGLGEMVKLHLMAGEATALKFLESLEKLKDRDEDALLKWIYSSLSIKKSFIEEDEFDTGRRNLLNYGHCFGRALESATNFAIPHGQAVVLGMIIANKVAVKKGVLTDDQERFIREKFLLPACVVELQNVSCEETVAAMQQDKKNVGKGLSLIMMQDHFGLAKIVNLQEDEALGILQEYFK